jgi:hypothetical protein
MFGEFGEIEKNPATPAKIVGIEVCGALKDSVSSYLNLDNIQVGMVYKNQNKGGVINVRYQDGGELTTGHWLLVQELVTTLFSTVKNKYADRPEFESTKLTFIDKDDEERRQIIINARLQ